MVFDALSRLRRQELTAFYNQITLKLAEAAAAAVRSEQFCRESCES